MSVHPFRHKKNNKRNTGLKLKEVVPLTKNQQTAFDLFDEKDVISLVGSPGTGKTFIALYLALREMEENADINKVVVVRSTVSVRDIGFQPGDTEEKISVYANPYIALCSELYSCGTAWDSLRTKDQLSFMPTSFMRGITFSNTIVIVDEAQNLDFGELHTIITRFGSNCKMILCGDTGQDDLTSERYSTQSGLAEMLSILRHVDSAGQVTFGIPDIVRSGFIKEYLIAMEQCR